MTAKYRSILLNLLVPATMLLQTQCREAESASEQTATGNPVERIVVTRGIVTDTNRSPKVPQYCVFARDTVWFDTPDMRERMDRELIAFAYSHSTSILMLKRAPKFFPQVEKILARENIPDDLKYLMVIESNLDPSALSTAGAAGLWQFTAGTGKQYGLEINTNIDERYNTEKATRAACRYLRESYDKYGDWLTVAASYNGGQNRITKELERQHRKKATELWIANETSRYMFRLLVAKMLFTDPTQFGFYLDSEDFYTPMDIRDTVTVHTSIPDLVKYAESFGISYRELKAANPWLRDSKLKNSSHRTYRIAIPARRADKAE